MIDKDLLRLLGGNKKYIAFCVGLMVLGLGIEVDEEKVRFYSIERCERRFF